jgi:alkylation response protein AidB-like acyl-CoA dehydrogenase
MRSGKTAIGRSNLVKRVSLANRDGLALINAAQVEPRIGSPSHGALPETIARHDGDRWLISGHKIYTTGIPILKWVVVLALTDEVEPRLASFLVPVDSPGLTIKETWNATGMRATASHDIVLDNVAVPIEDIIDPQPASEGLKRDETVQAWYFALIASVYHGVARAAGEWSADFASLYSPGSLGAPISTVPRVQDSLGDIEIRLATNERLLRSLADDVDSGRPIGAHAAIVKYVVVDNAIAITSAGLDIGGNPGLSRSNAIERHHRNALCARAHAPQNNMIRIIAAKAALAKSSPSQIGTPIAPKSRLEDVTPFFVAAPEQTTVLQK